MDIHSPARRLDTEQLAEKLYIQPNVDGFYIVQDNTKVEMFVGNIVLTDFFWNPGRDLVIHAYSVTLPRELTFAPFGKSSSIRNVYIQARDLIVQPGGSTIDVSGLDGSTVQRPANDGAEYSDHGADGKAGDPGTDGGNVFLDVENIIGGHLTVIADGGHGGSGQPGGNGRRGEEGRVPSTSACCECTGRMKKKERSACLKNWTKGFPGGDGGRAGNGGKGGQGGKAGAITVLYSKLDADANLTTSNQPGAGGAPGAPGLAGIGGPGGAGVPQSCKSYGFTTREALCVRLRNENVGEVGDEGASGDAGQIGTAGISGEVGESLIQVNTTTELRTSACPQQVRQDIKLGDELWKRGNLEESKRVLEWVFAIDAENTPPTPRSQCPSTQADADALWLTDISRQKLDEQGRFLGNDYFGNPPNWVPATSFETASEAASRAASNGAHLEAAYDQWLAQKHEYENTETIYDERIKSMEGNIATADGNKQLLAQDISQIRQQIRKAQETQRVVAEVLNTEQAVCDLGIQEKAKQEAFNFTASLQGFSDYWKSVSVIVMDDLNSLSSLGISSESVWQSGISLGDSSQTFYSAAQVGVADSQYTSWGSSMNTIVSSTENMMRTNTALDNTVSSGWVTLNDNTFQNKRGRNIIESRERMVEDTKHTDAFFEWVADIDECKDVQTWFLGLQKATRTLDDLVAKHDADLLKYEQEDAAIKANQIAISKDRNLAVANKYDQKNSNDNPLEDALTYTEDEVVRRIQDMQLVMNHEFCTAETWSVEFPSRVMQLDAIRQDLVAQRQARLADSFNGRGVIANQAESVMSGARFDASSSAIVVTVTETGSPNSFANFAQMGDLTFQVTASDLPKGIANLRVVEVQATSPDVTGAVDIWIEKGIESTCTDTEGASRIFKSNPQRWVSAYDTSGKLITGVQPDVRGFNLPPVGEWTIAFPGLDQTQRETIKSVNLKLVISYVACKTLDCIGGSEITAPTAVLSTGDKTLSSPVNLWDRVGQMSLIFASATLVSLIVVGKVLCRQRCSDVSMSLETQRRAEQVEGAVLARGL